MQAFVVIFVVQNRMNDVILMVLAASRTRNKRNVEHNCDNCHWGNAVDVIYVLRKKFHPH